MPVVHRIGAAHSAAVLAAFVFLVAAGLVAGWLRTGPGEPAKGQRGRLRELGWYVVLAVVAAATAYLALAQGNLQWWLCIIPLAAAAVFVLKPRLVAGIVPAWLIILGMGGIALARYRSSWLGLGHGGDFSTGFVLVLGYAFFLLGGWLAWRELSSRPATARLVLGRMSAPDRPGQLWGLLMLPVVVSAGTLVGSDIWPILTIALLVGSMLVIRRSPSLAARLATVGLIVLGLAGLLLVKSWSASGWPYGNSYRCTPGSCTLLAGSGRLYGAVDVLTQPMANLALAEALVLLGFGCLLVPRTFPEVRSLLGLAPYAELTRRVQRLTESRAVAVDAAAADLRRLERDLHDGAQARLVALGMSLRAVERLIPTRPDAALALVAEARETSARALTELRELVRGVHPPVLADRGLGDALRALAMESPLKIETDIELPGQLPAPVETACYFAVAEVLTNAAKHSGARDARIAAEHGGGRLRISVTDFGTGGADPANGTGLSGIERRLAAFDGIVAVNSPVGGPTMVVIEVPCALARQSLAVS
jgi:signal transduction histidine kinase